ncbi:hypothetical protein [Nitrosospira multiformis]|uniref:hypothetical protein n=1 Tax=Nitrosospira multiformis TaxID=1231 RepID=UPI001CA56CAD|nr:hypothetical protein [Nitrosospira multiformis]
MLTADSSDYRIKISKSGSSDLVATLIGPDGKEVKLNEPGGKDPVLRRASKGSYQLNLELPAVASKKGQDREELEKSATVRVQLIALPTQESPKTETPKPEASKPETPKSETPKPEASKSETPKSEAPKPETSKPETSKPETPKSEASKSKK